MAEPITCVECLGPAPAHYRGCSYSSHPFISLRDRIAMAALTGLVIEEGVEKTGNLIDSATRDAYRYADSMMKARRGGTP